ncbi:uncharacterized protein ACRADG_012882 [Cochliomyia hominivorax]
MTFKVIFALCLFGLINNNVKAEDSKITKFMKHLEVIPDVIDEGPEQFLKVTYDNGIEADKGVELTPTQVKNQPKIEWRAQAGTYYTLIMTDPDAPSRKEPKMREWHHWLVVNIPGDNLSKGEVLTEYVGSGPPKDSGLHRYTFLMFRQPKKMKFDEKHLSKTQAAGREKFSTKNFIKKYNLGAPIAGNFYQAQYDDYVLELYKQLGLEETINKSKQQSSLYQIMNFLIFIKLIYILKSVLAEAEDTDIIKAMRKHEVIPDLLDEGPTKLLKVSFDSGVVANMGGELTPTQVQNPPQVEWPAEKDTFYTLLFTEIDAPSREDTSLKEWRHWLIVNIPENNVDQGDVLNEYQGSGPNKGSGLHRYVYLLFEQPKKLTFEEKYSTANDIEGRAKFSTKKFAEKYNLGSPIAGNFYLAQYDNYSDILLRNLGF